MTLRRAVEEDVASLTALGHTLLEHHIRLAPEWLVPAGDAAWFGRVWGEYLAQFVARDDSLVLIAEESPGRPVGYLMAILHERPPFVAGPPDLMICEVAVDRTHRCHGVGAALMHRAYEWGRERGAGFVRLHVYERNTRAIAFYEREGFASHERVLLRRLDDDRTEE